MTKHTTTTVRFTRCRRRKVNADFGGGEITSNAGVLLLNEVRSIATIDDLPSI